MIDKEVKGINSIMSLKTLKKVNNEVRVTKRLQKGVMDVSKANINKLNIGFRPENSIDSAPGYDLPVNPTEEDYLTTHNNSFLAATSKDGVPLSIDLAATMGLMSPQETNTSYPTMQGRNFVISTQEMGSDHKGSGALASQMYK